MNDKYYVWVGSKLKEFRLRNKLTLEEVGKRIGKTKKQVQFYEMGQTKLYLPTIIKLCNIYNVDYMKFIQASIHYLEDES